MGKNREEYEKILEKLKSSYTEEDIIENLTYIVKGFSVHMFKEDLIQNPFYKSLLIDIKSDILGDLFGFKKSIEDEVDLINTGIESGDDVDKLIQLKIECKLLLNEIEVKIDEVKSI